MCVPSWKISFLGSAIFIGWCATILWVPRWSDSQSRKWYFAFGMGGDLLLYTSLYFITSLDVMIVVVFLFGLLTTHRVNIGFIYITEFTTKSGVTLFSTIYNLLEASIALEIAFYFLVMSNNWIYLSLVGYAMQVFSCVAVLFLPESPRLLVELGRYEEARQSLEVMARVNGKSLNFDLEVFKRAKQAEATTPEVYCIQIT